MNTVQIQPASTDKLAVRYARQLHELGRDLSDIREDVGQVLKEAKKDGIHAMALKLCLRLGKMTSLRRDEFLGSFDKYRADLELDAQQVLDLGDRPSRKHNVAATGGGTKPRRAKGGNGSKPRAPRSRKGPPSAGIELDSPDAA
jgi:uncharacterized protein (UPF0335 family)